MFSTEKLGFKKLSRENWRVADPVWGLFYHPEAVADPLDPLVADFLAVHLDCNVPLQIAQMFEVARGALVYGVMFYPLMTLGSEQICRVADAA